MLSWNVYINNDGTVRWKMETAEQKQTHGSGRILKPGPYSIKASLGPSSLEAPLPPLLPALTSCGYTLLLLLLLLPVSVSWSSVEQLPHSPACRCCHSAAPPCLLHHHHHHHHPPSSLHLLLHRYDCSCSNARYSKGRVCPCVCRSAVSSHSHLIGGSLFLVM